MKAIEIKGLKKKFGFITAVDDISLDIQKGEIFGFLGPNGAGKTTTIRCMMDFIRPTAGSIKVLGLDAQAQSVEAKSKIGFLSGDVRLYDNWTGQDHIEFVEKARGSSKIAAELSSRLEFNPKMKFKNYSSGNKQKLGLILALMHEPEVLILDEPTIGLDPLLQNTIYEILREHRQKGKTVFMSSHYLREVEMVCDRVGIIKKGKMVALETIDILKRMRLYRVTARFEEKADKNLFVKAGANIVDYNGHILVMQVKGDINPVMVELAKHRVMDVEIERASLEDIFMEYYRKEQS